MSGQSSSEQSTGHSEVSGARTILELPHVSVAVSMSLFFGRLVVARGELRFLPEARINALGNFEPATQIVHRDSELTVVYGRLMPPWMNSGLVLVDSTPGSRTVGLMLLGGRGARREVVVAAEIAGFDVEVYRTWFSAGGGIGSVAELDRFRREHNKTPTAYRRHFVFRDLPVSDLSHDPGQEETSPEGPHHD